MYFLGYHGTSEASAKNLLAVGVDAMKLPTTNQIGRGFYVARLNGPLPNWAASTVTEGARRGMPLWQQVVCSLTGLAPGLEVLLPDAARMTILKVYSTAALRNPRWNTMNDMDLSMQRRAGINSSSYLEHKAGWQQMVVAIEETPLLVLKRDDGLTQQPAFWNARETPTTDHIAERSRRHSTAR